MGAMLLWGKQMHCPDWLASHGTARSAPTFMVTPSENSLTCIYPAVQSLLFISSELPAAFCLLLSADEAELLALGRVYDLEGFLPSAGAVSAGYVAFERGYDS